MLSSGGCLGSFLAVMEFEIFQFEPGFQVEVDPEFPGDGEWDCPVISFDRGGAVASDPETRWGSPLVVGIEPASSPAWVATFAAGGVGYLRGLFATPSPSILLSVVDGLAYFVDVERPGQAATIAGNQIHQVAACEDPALVLLVGFTDIVAIGPQGIAWATPRLCVDDLRVETVSSTTITCSCDNPGRTTIALDPHTGHQIEGTRLDSFWPPDALA